MTALDSPNDPRHTAIESIIDELGAAEALIARIEARKAELLHRAGMLADEIGADRKAEACAELRAEDPDRLIHPKDVPNCHEMARRDLYARLGAALKVSDRTMFRWVDHAERLVADYPALHDALETGKISKPHTVAIIDAGIIITDPAQRERFEQAILEIAETESVNRVRELAKQLAEVFTDRSLDERAEDAHRARTVELHPLDDDLALVKAILPLTQATAVVDRLSRMARVLRTHERDHAVEQESPCTDASGLRTLAQMKADLFADLIIHGSFPDELPCCPAGVATPTSDNSVAGSGTWNNAGTLRPILEGITAHVQVVIPLMSLLPDKQTAKLRAIPGFEHLESLPGMHGTPHIVGSGPISSQAAKILAGNSPGWDRILTHPVTGVVEQVDRYQPTKSLRRLLTARDEHCRFPGCRMPARRCDADHTIEWARGGKTTRSNMAYLCRRHHTLRSSPG